MWGHDSALAFVCWKNGSQFTTMLSVFPFKPIWYRYKASSHMVCLTWFTFFVWFTSYCTRVVNYPIHYMHDLLRISSLKKKKKKKKSSIFLFFYLYMHVPHTSSLLLCLSEKLFILDSFKVMCSKFSFFVTKEELFFILSS